jgi:hypothetical protein
VQGLTCAEIQRSPWTSNHGGRADVPAALPRYVECPATTVAYAISTLGPRVAVRPKSPCASCVALLWQTAPRRATCICGSDRPFSAHRDHFLRHFQQPASETSECENDARCAAAAGCCWLLGCCWPVSCSPVAMAERRLAPTLWVASAATVAAAVCVWRQRRLELSAVDACDPAGPDDACEPTGASAASSQGDPGVTGEARDVLAFWFGDGQDARAQYSSLWFAPAGSAQQRAADATIAERFGGLLTRAEAGGLGGWRRTREGLLALTIVLDQFTRHVYRGHPTRGRSGGGEPNDLRALRCAEVAFRHLPIHPSLTDPPTR